VLFDRSKIELRASIIEMTIFGYLNGYIHITYL